MLKITNFYRDRVIYIVLEGFISLKRSKLGLFMKLGNDSTLGEEAQLDKHFQARLETASVDSPTA